MSELIQALKDFDPESLLGVECEHDSIYKPVMEIRLGKWRLNAKDHQVRFVTDAVKNHAAGNEEEYFGITAPFSWVPEERDMVILIEDIQDLSK